VVRQRSGEGMEMACEKVRRQGEVRQSGRYHENGLKSPHDIPSSYNTILYKLQRHLLCHESLLVVSYGIQPHRI
jgi:hypothetical protein